MANASRNGTGTFTRVYDWTDDAANSIAITASRFDEEMDGVAAELTNSVATDGQTTMTGDLKLGSNKVTLVADATLVTDTPNAGQVADNDFGYLGTTAGTSAAYTLTPSPAIAALVTGQEHSFTTNADNTLASSETTLAISGLTAKNLKKLNSSGAKIAVAAGDLKNGISYAVRYDGTDYLLTDQITAASSSASETVEGTVELATVAEVKTGTDTARVPSVSSMIGHEGIAKAWVFFDSTGTLSVYDSFNVSSVSDNGVGLFTVNFSTAFGSANYAVTGWGRIASGGSNISGFIGGTTAQANQTTGACPIAVWSDAGTNPDLDYIGVAFFGDR